MKKYKRGNRKHEIMEEVRLIQERKRKKTFDGPVYSSDRQTLPERIRYLRATHKPYMTQTQLAQRMGTKQLYISKLERARPESFNMRLNTLRRLAHALDCKVFINIKRTLNPRSEECLPLPHELPPHPPLPHKILAVNRKLVARYERLRGKKVLPPKHQKRHAKTSGKQGSAGDVEAPTE